MKRAELIEKWLEALESGKYKQGKGMLRKGKKSSEFRYCCLGVACEIAGLDFEKDTDGMLLPFELTTKIGIREDGSFKYPVFHGEKSYSALTVMNDAGIRFKTIARIIREQMAKGNFEKP